MTGLRRRPPAHLWHVPSAIPPLIVNRDLSFLRTNACIADQP